MLPLYQGLVIVLLITGVVAGLTFLAQHRPRQWRRLAAWDASGFVAVATAIYLRSLILTVLRWPGAPPNGLADALFSIGSLAVIDFLFILRVVLYRSFVQRDRVVENPPVASGGDTDSSEPSPLEGNRP